MAVAIIPQPPWCLTLGANILGDCSVQLRREWWGTIAAVVGHLGHEVSTNVVGFL